MSNLVASLEASREATKFDNDDPIRRRRRQSPDSRNSNESVRNSFGERRNSSRNEVKTGSRPRMNQTISRQDNISISKYCLA